MKQNYLLLTAFMFSINLVLSQQKPLVLVGATIIDISNYGNSDHDFTDAIVIIQNGKIKQVAKKETIQIPPGAQVIDVKGKFIVPGLIDGFSVLNNQGQANAHLYMGVTTISGGGEGDERRGDFFPYANPSPHVKRIIAIPGMWLYDSGYKDKLSPEVIRRIDHELDRMDSLKTAELSSQ